MFKYLKNYGFLVVFLAVFLLLSVVSSLKESLTFDEIVYIQGGRDAIISHVFDVDPYNPPLAREIIMLPYLFQHLPLNQNAVEQNSLPGRLTTILLSMILIVLIFTFTKKYIGQNEAIFATFLLTFEPTILGNSHYMTTDIPLTLLLFGTVFSFYSLLNRFEYKKLFLFSLLIGLGCSTKITFIPFVLLACVILFIFSKHKKLFFHFWYAKTKIFISVITALIVIWACYFFTWNVVIKGESKNTRVSAKITTFAERYNIAFLPSTIFFLKTEKIPLGDFLATLKNNAIRSSGEKTCFFLSSVQPCKWYFMPINFFLKTSLVLWIFFLTALAVIVKDQKKKIRIKLLTVIVSIFAVVIVLRIPPLVRYALPVIPFFVIFTSSIFTFWTKNNLRKILFGVLVCIYCLGTFFSFPHFISYANELTFGQKHFLFIDSNMDWGQSLPDVQKFISQQQLKTVRFSYFGRDNGDWYGLKSSLPYGSYKNNEICQFHIIHNENGKGSAVLISISNWYNCSYNTNPLFGKDKIKQIVGDSIFVF